MRAVLVALFLLCAPAWGQVVEGPQALPSNGSSGGVIGTDTVSYFVRTDGNDSNTCLANTAAGACLTIQAAFNKATTRSHAAASVNIADGTYTAGLACNFPVQIQAAGGIVVTGNAVTPANVIIDTSASNTNAVQAQNGCVMTVQHLTVTANGAAAGNDFLLLTGAIVYANDIIFGAAKSMHMDVSELAQVVFTGNSAITGGGVAHYHVHGGLVVDQAHTVSISNSPTFTSFFAGVAGSPGWLAVIGTTYTNPGTVTSPTSLLVHNGGFVDTQAACASFFPGTAAVVGSTGIDPATGGQCGGSGNSPMAQVYNSGINAQEFSPVGAQNYYLHGTGGGGMRFGAGIWLGAMYDATGTPTIASGDCGAGGNGVASGDNMSGTITIGASATTTCKVTFSSPLPQAPHNVFPVAKNATAAGQMGGLFVSAISSSSFTFTGTALANAIIGFEVR